MTMLYLKKLLIPHLYVAYIFRRFIYLLKHLVIMKTKQMTFRFNEDLINTAREMAKSQNRSLNNFIESLLYREVGHIPNDETIKAIDDARNDRNLERMDDLDEYFNQVRTEVAGE